MKTRLHGLSAGQRARLAHRLGGAPPTPPPAAIPRARPLRVEESPRVAVYPASPGQQRMWFLHHYAAGSPVYSSPTAFHLTGPLNVAWLQAAFDTVMQGHDLLRTTFAMEDGVLTQRVAAAADFQLQTINLEGTPADHRRAAAERCLDQEASRPFDLCTGPLVRALLVRWQPAEHGLLLVLHHIISDGWSRANFFRELAAAYAALTAGRPAPGRTSPVQFADYAAWQQDWLAGGAAAAQTAYWKAQLAGDPEPLPLPADHPRPATESFRGACCALPLEPGLTEALTTLAQAEGATLFMIMLAGFKVLLHRYTGQDDLVVGTPIANRQRVEVEDLIGYFANTLALRTQFPPGLTFRELLRRVKTTAVEAYANQDLPFDMLVEQLPVRRSASRTPLFQATFALQDFPAVGFNPPGIQSAPWPITTHTAKFDLSLNLDRSAAGWTTTLEYSTDLFEAGRMARMLTHWHMLLTGIVARPDQCVSQIPLLTEAERRQILVEWNQTGRDYPRDKCVHQLFEEQVERTPGAVAVMSGECALTYAELNTRANQLAHHLRSLGVGPDVLVGLCVERSPDMVVGQLGVLKAGGAHVPLDAALPPQRLQGMIRQAQIKLLLTHGSLTDRLETGTVQLIRLDQPLAAGPTTTPPSGVGPQHLCYVIFTSGSTGVPKGVRVPHQGVVNLAWWHKGAYGLGVGDRTSQLANLGFDAAAWEIWPTLVAGATLVIAEEDTLKNPEKLVAWLTRRQISVCFMPTPLAMAALQETWPPQSRLRYLLTGGDRLTVRPGGSLGFQLVNHYGPTEATVLATAGVVPPDPTGPPLPSLGRPIANVQVYIVDGHLNLLPPGLAGELCIGGDGLARDYLGEPELTAAKLIPNPFSSIPGARLYKTGDVARWSSDGELEFLGRRDDQVKIRGYRIELGELETALGTLPEVRQAVAIVRADLPGEPQLAAYLTAHGADQPAPATLRARLAEILPDYMIPHLFVWLDRLPLTPNGKVDRKALPAPDGSADTASGPKPPVNLLELELVRLWRRLFQREDIGTQDNFFELGGHSLLAARLAAQIDRWVGCKLPIATLFQTPTIELLARRMADENWVPAWSSLVPLHPQGSRPPLFLIHGWGGDVFCFLELAAMLGPDQPVYGIQAVGLDGKSARHTTVEAMAAHYVREIVSFQPAGPLHLAGFSLGGTIAFEVARQLHARGRRVALLALLDSGPTGAVPRAVFTRVMGAYLVRRCRFHLRQWWHSPWRGQFHFLRGRWRALCFWLRQNRSTPPPVTSPPPLDSQPPQIPGFLDYYRAVAQAYRPGPYPGSAEFFSSGTDKPQWQWYWRHYVRGGVRCHHLSGAHHDMLLSPAHRPELAKALQTVLQHRQAWGR